LSTAEILGKLSVGGKTVVKLVLKKYAIKMGNGKNDLGHNPAPSHCKQSGVPKKSKFLN
jgi:hypothetical protein